MLPLWKIIPGISVITMLGIAAILVCLGGAVGIFLHWSKVDPGVRHTCKEERAANYIGVALSAPT